MLCFMLTYTTTTYYLKYARTYNRHLEVGFVWKELISDFLFTPKKAEFRELKAEVASFEADLSHFEARLHKLEVQRGVESKEDRKVEQKERVNAALADVMARVQAKEFGEEGKLDTGKVMQYVLANYSDVLLPLAQKAGIIPKLF